MKRKIFIAAAGLSGVFSTNLTAAPVSVPVPIDYRAIESVMIKELYRGGERSARLWKDKSGCSAFDVSNPSVGGQQDLVRIVNDVQARLGTHIGGQCMTLLEWAGKLETFQQPRVEAGGAVLRFPIVKAIAYDSGGQALRVERLQDLIQRVAEPKLAALKIDLREARGDIEKTLAPLTPSRNQPALQAWVSSLRFETVKAGDEGLVAQIGFEIPQSTHAVVPKQSEAPFNEHEMQQWRSAWQRWQASLIATIDHVAQDKQNDAMRDTLTETLLEAHAAFEAGLTLNDTAADPVREFFNTTWERLAPLMRTIASEIPGAEGLHFLTFLAATDVLYELERIGSPLGLDLSSDGLRRLTRQLLAKQKQG